MENKRNAVRTVTYISGVLAISSALILILGFWLIFSPDEATRVTEVIAGISLILKAIELFGKANINRKVPPTRKSGDIEADFVDKSDEL